MSHVIDVLVLTRYSRLGASSRLRFLQFLPELERFGFRFTVEPLLDDHYLSTLYNGRPRPTGRVAASYLRRMWLLSQSKNFDLIWLEKEALPWIPFLFERVFTSRVPLVVDFDDAWFHRYDKNPNPLIKYALGGKLEKIMQSALTVISGNEYVSARAAQVGAHVVQLPTVVNIDQYPEKPRPNDQTASPFVVAWIGTPVTARYLNLVAPVLRDLGPDLILRLIGAGPLEFEGIKIEHIAWNEHTEADVLHGCHVGIMPLSSGLWEQGKSGFKLIQYMASSLPAIASPIGANCDIIVPGVTGFLPEHPEDWKAALSELRASPAKAIAMGEAGRRRCIEKYSTQAILPHLLDVLKKAVQRERILNPTPR